MSLDSTNSNGEEEQWIQMYSKNTHKLKINLISSSKIRGKWERVITRRRIEATPWTELLKISEKKTKKLNIDTE